MNSPRTRPLEARDIPDLIQVSRAVIEDGRGVVHTLETADLDDVNRRYAPFLKDAELRDSACFVAEDEGRVIGCSAVQRLRPALVRHVAVLSLEVAPSSQGRGLGRALLRAIIDWADAHAIDRLELYTRADNLRAIALYES